MIHTIIFSFNRAIQLELLLKSINRFDSNRLLTVTVLYAFTDETFRAGYEKLKSKFPRFRWVPEEKHTEHFVFPTFPLYWHNYYWWIRYAWSRKKASNFRCQLIDIIAGSSMEQVMFLTDDSMFFDEVNVPSQIMEKIRTLPYEYSFSLRHGKNVSGGNVLSLMDLLYCKIYEPGLSPEWAYPFSIDGHVYNKEFLLKAFKKVWFKNPNTLEGNIACYLKENRMVPVMYFNEKSALVGFELNRVQNVHQNHNLDINPAYLNLLYTNGYSMDIRFNETLNNLYRPEKFSVQVSNNVEVITVFERT
jgi:hypothetical protein